MSSKGKIDTGFSQWDETLERTVRESFDIVDDNGDGRINLKEFQSFMKLMGKAKKAKELFKILDKNCNGTVEYSEYRTYMKAVWELAQNGNVIPHLKLIFDACDKPANGKTGPKGYLTPKEFYRFLKLTDVNVSVFDRKDVLKRYDENGDRVISLEEITQQIQYILPPEEEKKK